MWALGTIVAATTKLEQLFYTVFFTNIYFIGKTTFGFVSYNLFPTNKVFTFFIGHRQYLSWCLVVVFVNISLCL